MSRWALISLIVLSPLAAAAEQRFYVGGGRAAVHADYSSTDRIAVPAGGAGGTAPRDFVVPTEDLKPFGSNAWRAFAGYRPLDWLAIEGDFTRFNSNSAATGIVCVASACPFYERGRASAISVSLLGIRPIGSLEVFGRVGAAKWRVVNELFDATGPAIGRQRSSATQAHLGAGIQYHFTRVSTRLEYERFVLGPDSADLYTLGISVGF